MLGETDTFGVSNDADSILFGVVVGVVDLTVGANDNSVVDDIAGMTDFTVSV